MAALAYAIDAIPVVSGTGQRDNLYPTPATNQRVQNLASQAIERFTGAAWVAEFFAVGAAIATNLTIAKAQPVVVLSDTGAVSDAATTAYVSFQRAGVEKGWVGFGDGASGLMRLRNNIGEVRLSTPGGDVVMDGAAAVFRPLAAGGVDLGSTTVPWSHLHLSSYVRFGTVGGATSGFFSMDNANEFDWYDSTGTTRFLKLTSTALSPYTAGGLPLGTAALPWGPAWISDFVKIYNPSATTLWAGIQASALDQLDFFKGTGVTTIMRLSASALSPMSVGGLSLGTAALPWGTVNGGGLNIWSGGQLWGQFAADSLGVFGWYNQSSVERLILDTSAALKPASPGVLTLGNAALPWGRVFMGDNLNMYSGATLWGTLAVDALNIFGWYTAGGVERLTLDMVALTFGPAQVAGDVALGTVAKPWGRANLGDVYSTSGNFINFDNTGVQIGFATGNVTTVFGTVIVKNPAGTQTRWTFDSSGNLVADTANGGTVRSRVGTSATVAKHAGVFGTAFNAATTSTSDVSVASFTLPANALATNGDLVRVFIHGIAATQNATINLKFGATVALTTTITSGNRFWVMWTILRNGAASQQVDAVIVQTGAVGGNTSVTASETMSGAVTIDLRGSVVAGGTLTYTSATAEVVSL